MEEEGRQDPPQLEEVEVVALGGDEHQEPGTDGGDLHGVAEGMDRDRERSPAPGTNICCVCHEPWATSGAHRICCIPCGHLYGRSCLELWLVRSQSRSRGNTAAAAKCLWCGQEFRHEHIINLYGATEHLLPLEQQQVQVATTEEQQEQEYEYYYWQHQAVMEAEAEAARQWRQQQQQAGHGHDLQAEAAANAIARINQAPGVAAVAQRNGNPNNNGGAAAAGFSWRSGALAWKRVGLAWRIDVDGDGAVAEAAAGGGGAPAAGTSSSSVVAQLGVGILVFILAALLCLIM